MKKKNYIILNFNYPIVNILFFFEKKNQKVGYILNLISKASLSILPTRFQTTKKKKIYIFNERSKSNQN